MSSTSVPAGLVQPPVFGHHQTWVDQLVDQQSLSLPQQQKMKFVNATVELLKNQMKKEEIPKKKRTRTTPEQLKVLQNAFEDDPMPNAIKRMHLAERLGMSPRAVQIWFQNRRAKGKLDMKRSQLNERVAEKYEKKEIPPAPAKKNPILNNFQSTDNHRPYRPTYYLDTGGPVSQPVVDISSTFHPVPKTLMLPNYYENQYYPVDSSAYEPVASNAEGLGIDMSNTPRFPNAMSYLRRCFSLPNVYDGLESVTPNSSVATLPSLANDGYEFSSIEEKEEAEQVMKEFILEELVDE